MIKIFASERSSVFKMIKFNFVHLSPATSNTPGYYQAVPSNCHRLIFTMCCSIKKNPAIDPSYFGEYNPERTAFVRYSNRKR